MGKNRVKAGRICDKNCCLLGRDTQVTSHMPGFYEHSRDDQRTPACWRRLDNACFPHFHSSLELVYVRSGVMEATLAGRSCRVEQRQLLIVPSYTVHLYESPAGSDTYVLTVPMDYITSVHGVLKDRTFAVHLLADSKDTREIQHCMKALCARPEPTGDSPVYRGYVHVILGLLLERVPLTETARQTDTGQIQKILGFLHRNYQSPLSLERIAAEFGYSGSRFSHIFNQNVGCSISHYINTLRCRNAAALLEEQEISVLDAAMASGFESMRTFYRAFRRCYGVTPSQYIGKR